MKTNKKNSKKTKSLVDIDPAELDIDKAKMRITMWVNFVALDKIRTEAEEKGIPYQTFINQILMEYANTPKKDKIKEIEERITLLEKKVS
jgi:predicted DNA binding CopG/RHH family protein